MDALGVELRRFPRFVTEHRPVEHKEPGKPDEDRDNRRLASLRA